MFQLNTSKQITYQAITSSKIYYQQQGSKRKQKQQNYGAINVQPAKLNNQ